MLHTTKPWVSYPALHQLGVVAHAYNPSMRKKGSWKFKTSKRAPNKIKQTPRGKIAPPPTTL